MCKSSEQKVQTKLGEPPSRVRRESKIPILESTGEFAHSREGEKRVVDLRAANSSKEVRLGQLVQLILGKKLPVSFREEKLPMEVRIGQFIQLISGEKLMPEGAGGVSEMRA